MAAFRRKLETARWDKDDEGRKIAYLCRKPGKLHLVDVLADMCSLFAFTRGVCGCENRSLWALALALLRDMFDRRLDLDVVSYSCKYHPWVAAPDV